MQLSNAPAKLVEAFAVSGNKRTVPVPSQTGVTPGAASFHDGFPPLCATPVPSGGIPPSILDMNGSLFQISSPVAWGNAGASFVYDSVFSAAIGGYPKGARLLMAATVGYWISTVDNNVTDPDTGGAGWIPDRAYASVFASAQQTLASGISKVLWDTVEFDPLGLWNSGAQVFQAIWGGRYRVSGAVYLPAPAGQLLGVGIYINGTLAKQCAQYPQVSDGAMTYPFDAIIGCAAADQLFVKMDVPTTAVLAGQSGSNESYVYGQIEILGS